MYHKNKHRLLFNEMDVPTLSQKDFQILTLLTRESTANILVKSVPLL